MLLQTAIRVWCVSPCAAHEPVPPHTCVSTQVSSSHFRKRPHVRVQTKAPRGSAHRDSASTTDVRLEAELLPRANRVAPAITTSTRWAFYARTTSVCKLKYAAMATCQTTSLVWGQAHLNVCPALAVGRELSWLMAVTRSPLATRTEYLIQVGPF